MSKTKFDILTVGSATQDVFLFSKAFKPQTVNKDKYNIIPFGDKIDVSDIVYETGGSATNTAVTFARQGFKVACLTKIGLDSAGREVLHQLEKEGVATSLVKRNAKHHTGYSALLKPYSGDRTILIHRGASMLYEKADFNLSKVKADWLLITSLNGDLKLLKQLVDWAKTNGVKVAINPGAAELNKPRRLLKILTKASVVILNRDEAEVLVGYNEPEELLVRARDAGISTLVMTDGSRGAWAVQAGFTYHCGLYKKVRVIDRTGAGDAFGSGYVAAILRGGDVERGLTMGAANATSVISYIGAKAGILRNSALDKFKINKNYI